MSNENCADEAAETDNSINRRRFVKSLGVAGGATFGVLGSGRVSAKRGINSSDGSISSANNEESSKYAAAAQNTSEFKILQNHLKEQYGQKVKFSETRVAKANIENGPPSYIVKFETVYAGSSSTKSDMTGDIVVVLQNDITVAGGTLQYVDKDGSIQATEMIVEEENVKEETVEEQSPRVTPSFAIPPGFPFWFAGIGSKIILKSCILGILPVSTCKDHSNMA